MKRKLKLVAEIALYGTPQHGAGFIAHGPGGHIAGDGELRPYWSMTEAVWMALSELRVAGISEGIVRIFAPGGQLMAESEISKVGYYGNLKWQRAPQYSIEVEELVRASGVPV